MGLLSKSLKAGGIVAGIGVPLYVGASEMYGASTSGVDPINTASIGAATAAASIGAGAAGGGVGMIGGAAVGAIAARPGRKMASIKSGMKFGGFAGTALAASVSAGLVGRGMSSITHAPRHVLRTQTALSQRGDGRIKGLDT